MYSGKPQSAGPSVLIEAETLHVSPEASDKKSNIGKNQKNSQLERLILELAVKKQNEAQMQTQMRFLVQQLMEQKPNVEEPKTVPESGVRTPQNDRIFFNSRSELRNDN